MVGNAFLVEVIRFRGPASGLGSQRLKECRLAEKSFALRRLHPDWRVIPGMCPPLSAACEDIALERLSMEYVTCSQKNQPAEQSGDGCADSVSQEVLDAIEAQVQRCLGGRVRDFHVEFRSEGPLLQGQSHTYHAKQLAQQRVMERSELPILANDIVVE